jgi:type I restriction enzyme S subunit
MSEEATLNDFADQDDSGSSNADKSDEGWPIKKLSDHIELVSGVHVKSDNVHSNDGGTPYLTGPEDFEGLGFTVTKYTDEPTKYTEPSDTLVTVKGSGCGKTAFSDQRACISRQLKALRPDSSINPLYLYYTISREEPFLETLSEGSAIPGLSNSHLTTLDVPVPDIEEQLKIASILYNVDQAIQKTEDIIGQTNKTKEGVLQELFTTGYYDHTNFKKTRVGELPKSWKLDKIKNHVELVSGAHVKSDLVSDDDSLSPYLTGPEDFDEFGFTVTKYTSEPTKFCEPEDTLVTVKGSGCGKSTYAIQRACISRQLKALRPKDSLEPLYLFYFIKTKQNLLENLAEGSAIPGLSNSHLTTLDIPIPNPEEQREIADTLREIDRTIEHENKYRNQLQFLKKGLMQDLLSGTVRTTDTNIEVLPEVVQHG